MRTDLLDRSNVELIAAATGRRGTSAIADAHKLLQKVGLKKLPDAGVAEIQAVCKGMTDTAVNRLMAGVEIGLRIAELKSGYDASIRITSPATAVIGRFKTSHSWALQNQQGCGCSVSGLQLVLRTHRIAASQCFDWFSSTLHDTYRHSDPVGAYGWF